MPTKNELLLAVIFRGLTYDYGVVSGDYLGSDFPSSDWLILSEIHYNGQNPGDLSKLLSTGKATISLRLKASSAVACSPDARTLATNEDASSL